MEDITALKNTIEELRRENESLKSEASQAAILTSDQRYQESQVRFRTVFEESTLGNKIISSDLKILQVNPAMVSLLGLDSKDEIIGSVILDYAPSECHQDWKFLQEKLWQHASPSFCLETCLKRKDGAKIWCQVTSILFKDGGDSLGYTIIEDITEKHKLRLQKEEFISVASHELKTPVTSLQATIQILNKIVKEETVISDQLKKLATHAERHCKKLGHLIGDLLNTTRIEHGQLALNKNIFKISDLVDSCCSHLQGNHHLKFTGDHSLEVTADQNKIDQVLVNLFNNAVKYAPESEEIIIHVEKSGNFTKIAVTDSGPGIPPGSISRLFDRYYRVDADKRQSSGLGLGLYISSEIIKRHNGTIGVESTVGLGSTFWFTLPDIVPARK